jgi:hypothetical protein
MATVKHAIGEHDYVELRDPVGRWPSARRGAVVSDYGEVKLIEISDERGAMLDLIQVPETGLKLITKHSA